MGASPVDDLRKHQLGLILSAGAIESRDVSSNISFELRVLCDFGAIGDEYLLKR